MQEKYSYEQRVIAYLDILSTKELIKNKEDAIVFDVMSILDNFKTQHRDKFEISVFSDNIAISFRLLENDKENLENLRILILWINLQFCAELFLAGILFRGSITSGKLYHKNDQIIGQALIDAYEMESKFTFYPRIILSQKIEELINQNDVPTEKIIIVSDGEKVGTRKITQNYSSTIPIKLSEDGYSYLDWLHLCVDEMVEEDFNGMPIVDYRPNFQFIEELKQTIENNLTNHKGSPSIWSKWRWVAIYFNNIMKERDLTSHQVDAVSIKSLK